MTATLPDVRDLRDEALPVAPFPGSAAEEFRVYFDPGVHERIRAHCEGERSVEVCGVLVGRWERDDAGPYARVDASIRGTAATSRFAEVTFTHETWAQINRRMDGEFADRSIVGWYHSHPDFGIFLSDRDRFIHEHFFAAPGQVAMVVDPVRDEEGVFVWHGGRPELAPLHWVGDKPRVPPPVAAAHAHGASPSHASREPRHGDHAATMSGASSASSEPPPRARVSLAGVLAALCLILIGFMVGGLRDRLDRARLAEQMSRQLVQRTDSLLANEAIASAMARLADAYARLGSAGSEASTGDAATGDSGASSVAADEAPVAPPRDGAPVAPPRDEATVRHVARRDIAAAWQALEVALRALELSAEERLTLDLLVKQRLDEVRAAQNRAAATEPGQAFGPAPADKSQGGVGGAAAEATSDGGAK